MQRSPGKKRFLQQEVTNYFSKKLKQGLEHPSDTSETDVMEKSVVREKLASAAERRMCNQQVSVESCTASSALSVPVVSSMIDNNGSADGALYVCDTESNADSSSSQLSVDLFPESQCDFENSAELSSLDSQFLNDTELISHEDFSTVSSDGNVDAYWTNLVPPIPNQFHTVACKIVDTGGPPQPVPSSYQDRWDGEHVRFPCSPESFYPVEKDGNKKIERRWEIIQESLLTPMTSSSDIERAILQYNKMYADRWNFKGLHFFFREVLMRTEARDFFETTLPAMVRLALSLPELCTQPIPLLRQHQVRSITLSQKQVGCLLANAFFCTFPRRNTGKKNSEYSSYPDINFNRLFASTKAGISHSKAEKLRCLINYFKRITTEEPMGTITFHRKYLQSFPDWSRSRKTFRNMTVHSEGLIEKEGVGMLQVDFANKFVGGGVLGMGCVQEEIRFLICPELLLARLFTEKLDVSEALLVIGCEQYNDYYGYADTFMWAGDYRDSTPRDKWGRRKTHIVAMDALYFFRPTDQYKPALVERELNKAFCSFNEPGMDSGRAVPVATGNWGCGAFHGDPQLKSLIQLMATTMIGRDLVYFTFGNKQLKEELQEMHSFLVRHGLTVGDIWALLVQYSLFIMHNRGKQPKLLFEFIYMYHAQQRASTDVVQCDVGIHVNKFQNPDRKSETFSVAKECGTSKDVKEQISSTGSEKSWDSDVTEISVQTEFTEEIDTECSEVLGSRPINTLQSSVTDSDQDSMGVSSDKEK